MNISFKLTNIVVVVSIIVGGCSIFSDNELRSISFPGVYKIDIQQGNIITQDMVAKLKPEMSRQQVAYILGLPLLPDSFDENRWDYVYTFQDAGNPHEQQVLTVLFKDNLLVGYSGNINSEINTKASLATQNKVVEEAKQIRSNLK